MAEENTQKRYNPLFEAECSKRKAESHKSGELELLPSGKLTRKQSAKFINYAIQAATLRVVVTVQCLQCNAWYRDNWWSRLWHSLICWLRLKLR